MYEGITHKSLLENMLSRVSNSLDKREGAVIYDTHSPTAIELLNLYIELDRILNESFADTSSRVGLILKCRERGITPYSATKAVLKGEFLPENIDVAGKRFNLETLNFVVTNHIEGGFWEVECEEAGTINGLKLGTLLPIEYVEGLESARLVETLIPGEDEEGTEDLRLRYFNSFTEQSFGGNVADYLEKTEGIAGVGGVKVKRVWNNGIIPAKMIPNEAVCNWYESVYDSLQEDVKSWLSFVYEAGLNKWLTVGGTVLLTIIDGDFSPASQTLIDLVQNTMDPEENAGDGLGLAPIGHIVSVQSVSGIDVFVQFDITFDKGYSFENMQGEIENAISQYLLELRHDWKSQSHLIVRISQIETRILALKGVIDISGTLINGDDKNLILGEFEVPLLGGVSE